MTQEVECLLKVMDFFVIYISKTIGKNIRKNFTAKRSQKPLDHAKQYVTNVPKIT